MNIFLTSQASHVLERIVPLMSKRPSECTTLFIPTAAKPYLLAPWMERDREELERLGFALEELHLDTATAEEVSAAVAAADVIFVGGGNTFYLLEETKRTGFDSAVRAAVEAGAVYIGSSAGSVLAAPDIEYVDLFDDRTDATLTDTKGIGLVTFSVLPHFDNPKYAALHERVLEQYKDSEYRLVPLGDEQFAVPKENGWEVFG